MTPRFPPLAGRRVATVLAAGLTVGLLAAGPPASAAPQRPDRPVFGTAELDRTQRTLDQRWAAPPAGITAWGVDPGSGRVVVSVLAGDAAALRTAQSVVADLPAVTITTVTERPHRTTNLLAGQIIRNPAGRCSLGFSALTADRSAAVVITAGHCTTFGGTWTGDNRVPIGPVLRTSFPIDDFGDIRVESTTAWTPTAQIRGSGASIVGSAEAAVGSGVCRTGSTTGYRCGTILAKNQTVSYDDGSTVRGVTKTSACAEPGDSGGPYFTYSTGTTVQAQGVASGASGSCSSGSTAVTWFQPIQEILTSYGLTLYTASTTPLPAKPNVTLCSANYYGGTCVVSNTDQPLMITSAVGQDQLSSVRVPAGTWLSLYADDKYTGVCQAFTADQPVLAGTRVGNDRVSSYKITTTAPAGCPTT